MSNSAQNIHRSQNTLEFTSETVVDASWFQYLVPEQQTLVQLALDLYARELMLPDKLPDYSFIVFPMSKAYEGFLKQFLFDLQLIDRKTLEGKRFRIGRALNPDMSVRYKDEYWHYDNVVQLCSEQVARELWDTWLEGRNRLFHFFYGKISYLSKPESGEYLERFMHAMQMAAECKLR